MYIADVGCEECKKDEKFWVNFYCWKEAEYGARGPTSLQWDEILQEE